MRYQPVPPLVRRWLAALLSLLLGLGPLATPAYAGLTPLADEPINIKNQAKPNIILTVDDSSSMLFDFLPDYVIGTSDPSNKTGKPNADLYCRDGTGAMQSRCGDPGSQNDFSAQGKGKYTSPGYIFQQFGVPYKSFAAGFDASGPGAGCDTSDAAVSNNQYMCSGGIDPGPSPGIATYPSGIYGPRPGWAANPPQWPAMAPKPAQPYEYWLLWPAPVHNSAFNHIYYNPRLTYDPPAAADGTSYPQMDAATTSGWTKVPADPWADPTKSPTDCTSQPCIDLTAKVTVGQWCNSDWTQGTNPATGNPFASSADGSVRGDAAFCRTNGVVATALSVADTGAGGDYTYPWPWPGSGAKDPKYFYQNDNELWCDATSASWPQNGPVNVTQTCNGVTTQTQTCGAKTQTCGGGTVQTCSAQAQTCVGAKTQTCANQTTPQTCQGGTPQTCGGISAQTCIGSSTQTCNNITAQTCNGYTTQACSNINAQTCNGYKTQTCDNLTTVCTPPPPSSCTTTLEPPGCGGPEAPVCTPTTTCPPDTCVTSGKCTVSNATCTAANASTVCTPINGACSASGAPCQPVNAATQCPAQGKCSVSNVACTAANASSVCTAINGTCSASGVTCQPANAATQCPASGKCSISNVACTAANASTVCTPTSGTCSKTNAACTVANASVNCPASGKCTVSNANCTSNAQCPTLSKACSITGTACTTTCPNVGKCTVTSANCTSNAQCPTQPGTCSVTAAACTTNANCPTQAGKCNLTNAACTSVAQCPNQNQKCSVTNAACTSNSQCPTVSGVCSIVGNACTSNANCPAQTTAGACSVTGLSCTSNAQCPNQPSPSGSAVCSDTMNASTKSLLEDAADPAKGIVCRRNNQAYTGTNPITAGRFNYPDTKYKTMVTGGTGANACSPTPRYTSIPRHYWKTEVEWCDTAITAGSGDKWAGYGTATNGSCKQFKDVTHTFPRFYEFGVAIGSAEYGDNYATPAFQRVDLDIGKRATATYTHTWAEDPASATSAVDTVTRTFDEEMTNYANWFAYYRTRIQAVKSVTSLTFLGKTAGTFNLDDSFRVGFHTLSNLNANAASQFDPAKFVDIADFDLVKQKPAWAKELFGITIPLGLETPNLNAMIRIGKYYSPGGSSELSGATDPIVLSCQKNWHMLFTDGFTNQKFPATTVGDQDDTVPATIPVGGPAVAGTGLTAGQPWPRPFREDPSATVANSASDYATNYWITNLRPAMPENVATSGRDPASWPHQNFAAMSLGTQGVLSGAQGAVETQLANPSGTLQWPKPQPTVNQPDNSAVDDLWHAAINGRGRFVNAQSADELKLGMGQILQDVVNQAGARIGAAFQGTSVTSTNNFIYRVNFEPGWGARLRKIQVDPTSGAEIPPDVWDAAAQLRAQLTVVPGVKDTPWFTERKIVTVDETGKAVPFLAAGIGTNQLDSLAPGKTARAKSILEFLRGNQSREGAKIGEFRVRIGGLLGDIVDSQPVYVGAPRAPYLDANDPGYAGYAAKLKGRPARVYVGANDGMLHAFDDATGNEAWAFIPSALFRPDDTGLGALSYQDGALPPFKHHFYVNATPRISDVNFGGGDTDWHTILVGGLGKGGKSYYALDISQPSDITSETELAKRVLWQFTDPDLGYTYGRAIIAKTHAFGGKWMVIVPSGYNNVGAGATGEGKIFFLEASTGKLRKTLSTGSGSLTDPSGLAQIAAYEKDFRNQIAEQIYGGDLQGNFWRFDISDPVDANWGAPDKIAQLTDPVGGKPQPVTTPPQIEIDIANGVDRWVFVGTGRLLDDLDLTTPAISDQIQTMYAFRDGTATAPITPWPATLAPRTDMAEVTDAAGLAAKPDKGWFDDLPVGQRIVVPVQAALSVIAYVGTSPQTDPCLTGQPATLYAREYGRGDSLLVDSSKVAIESSFYAEGIVGLSLVTLSGGSSDSGAGGFPDLRIAITSGQPNTATAFIKPKAPDFAQAHRMSWRLLGQ